MIVKITNQDENFYHYMGKFFGSRIVQAKTKDRLYDDNEKVWYLNMTEDKKILAFGSVVDRIIKNLYTNEMNDLTVLLQEMLKDIKLLPSTVPLCYEDCYKACNIKITRLGTYKNFVVIRSINNEA